MEECPIHLRIVVPSEAWFLTYDSGDSYSSIGYDVDGDVPSLRNPLGNPPYPGETWSAGPNWVFLHLQGSLRLGGLSCNRV